MKKELVNVTGIVIDFILDSLTGIALIFMISPIVLNWFIHGDEDRYRWILSGPYPFNSFGGGPFQLWLYVALVIFGILIFVLSRFIKMRRSSKGVRKGSVYFIAQIKINDIREYELYLKKCNEIFSSYSGEYLAVDSSPEILEGEWDYTRSIIIKFPDESELKKWYESEEYQEILKHRLKAADCDTIIVHGIK